MAELPYITRMKVWGSAYDLFRRRGMSEIDARYAADQHIKKGVPDRWRGCTDTHCERQQECRAPSDCCANMRYVT